MTTGVLLPAPVFVAVNGDGAPIPGALLQVYLTGTTTPATVYADSGLATPLTNPVVANGDGMFAAIYLDPTVTYRLQLQTATGGVIADIDPANLDVAAASQAQVNAGSATGVYVSPATLAGWTGVLTALGYTALNVAGTGAPNGTMSGELTLASGVGPTSDHSAGFRGMPVNTQTASYQPILDDAGKLLVINDASAVTLTLPANATVAFPVGATMVVLNSGAGALAIAAASGVTLWQVGSGAAGPLSLAQFGMATLCQISANVWAAVGTGLT